MRVLISQAALSIIISLFENIMFFSIGNFINNLFLSLKIYIFLLIVTLEMNKQFYKRFIYQF